MANMGYGLSREVYSRKPKKVFGKLKKRYGEHMEKEMGVEGTKNLTPDQRKALRLELEKKIRNERIRSWLIWSGLLLCTVTVVLIIVGIS